MIHNFQKSVTIILIAILTGCGSGSHTTDNSNSNDKVTYTNYENIIVNDKISEDIVQKKDNTTLLYKAQIEKNDIVVTEIEDTLAPVIKMNGKEIVELTIGDNYVEAGAVAIDDKDGEFNASIKSSNLNLQTAGTYHIIYTAQDKAGNISGEVIRTVIIKTKPNTAPVAKTQTVTLDEDTNINISLSATDVDNDALTFRVISQPEHGVYADGLYTPTANYYGNDSFTFVANDGRIDSQPAKVEIIINDIAEPTYQCTATATTETNFIDIFVDNNQTDRDWTVDFSKEITVEEIAAEFNAARASDPTISTSLVMPSQAEWDSYSDSEKALYLINSERCARGIRIFEGIDTSIITAPAQKYADYLKDNNTWGHYEDGRDPWERLEEDAGVIVSGESANADFFKYGENLAYIAYGTTENYPSIYEPVAISVYGWLYADKDDTDSEYGHRKFLLATGLNENFGETNKEGLIGVGVSTLQYEENGFKMTKIYTVLNAFDPNQNWENGANIIKVDIKAGQ